MLNWFKNAFSKKANIFNPRLKYAFTGVSGKKYYYLIDATRLDAEAVGHFNTARYLKQVYPSVFEYTNGMKTNELKEWLDQVKEMKAINQVQMAIQALEIRRQIAIDTELFFRICATMYFQEGEPMGLMSSELWEEKTKDIQKTVEQNEYFFFHYPMLTELLGLSSTSEINWSLLAINIAKQKQIFKKVMEDIRRQKI